MVVPVGEGEQQRMLKLEHRSDGELSITDLGVFRFVPMLKNKA